MSNIKSLERCDRCDKEVESGVYSDVNDSFYCDECSEYLEWQAEDRLYEEDK